MLSWAITPRAVIIGAAAAVVAAGITMIVIWRLLWQMGRWPGVLAIRPDRRRTMSSDVMRRPNRRVVVFAVARHAYWRSWYPITRVVGHDEGVTARDLEMKRAE